MRRGIEEFGNGARNVENGECGEKRATESPFPRLGLIVGRGGNVPVSVVVLVWAWLRGWGGASVSFLPTLTDPHSLSKTTLETHRGNLDSSFAGMRFSHRTPDT